MQSAQNAPAGVYDWQVFHFLAYSARLQGRLDKAEAYLREMEALAQAERVNGTRSPRSKSGLWVAHRIEIAAARGEIAQADEYLQQYLQQPRPKGEELASAGLMRDYSLGSLNYHLQAGEIAILAGRYQEAHTTLTQAIETGRITGYQLVSIRALYGLGSADLEEGMFRHALDHFEEQHQVATKAGRWRDIGLALVGMGRAAVGLGDLKAARRHFAAARDALANTQATPVKLDLLASMAELLLAGGAAARAAELLNMVVAHPAATWKTRQDAGDLLQRAGCTAQAPPIALSSDPAELPDIDRLLATAGDLCQ
jgi:tetratricopeptide (TPR) repeat protein